MKTDKCIRGNFANFLTQLSMFKNTKIVSSLEKISHYNEEQSYLLIRLFWLIGIREIFR